MLCCFFFKRSWVSNCYSKPLFIYRCSCEMNSCRYGMLAHPIELGRKRPRSDTSFISACSFKALCNFLSCTDPHMRVCICSVFYWSFCRRWRRRSSSTGLSTVDGIDRSFWLPCCSCSWLAVFSNYAFPSGVQWLSPLVMRLLPFHTSVMFCWFPFGTLHVSLTRALKAYPSCSPHSLLRTHWTVQTVCPAFVSLVPATNRHAKVASQHGQERACFAVIQWTSSNFCFFFFFRWLE